MCVVVAISNCQWFGFSHFELNNLRVVKNTVCHYHMLSEKHSKCFWSFGKSFSFTTTLLLTFSLQGDSVDCFP